jgi:hypothetical protein
MRTLAKIAATLGVVGAMASTGVMSVMPASAQTALDITPPPHQYRHHHYYNYYGRGGWGTYNGCPAGYTLQGGNCAPYRGPRGRGVPPGAGYWWQ